MTNQDFLAWLDHMQLNDSKAARVLGISRNSVIKYKEYGAPEYVAFACAALAFGLPKWSLSYQ